MEQTQVLDWDETLLSDDGTEFSQEPVGKLRLCGGAHGPERDFWIHVGDNIIGRHENCHITLPAQSVSKKHAVIEAEADCHTIYDCGSLNKTRRRKAILKPHIRYALADGDLLLFADVACQYFILPSENNREESTSPQHQAVQKQEQGSPVQAAASREDAPCEAPEDFDSDDESVLVPATQANAVKSLVIEKTPATRRMGYGGVLAKDSDEDDNDGENTIYPTGRSRGSEKSTPSRECGDLCTSVALESPYAATVIPESDDECAETSAVSAPSMHLQYNSDAEESLVRPHSAVKPCCNTALPSQTDGPSPRGMEVVASVQMELLNVAQGKTAGSHSGEALKQRTLHYHLDSDTDVDEEEEMKANKGGQKNAPRIEQTAAQLHVDSDTDVEEEPDAGTNGDNPGSKEKNENLGNGSAAPANSTAAELNMDSNTDVEEEVDTTSKAAMPVVDLGSDTDVEEAVDAPHGVELLRGSSAAAKHDNYTDTEEDGVSPGKAVSTSHQPAQDSDTDVEDKSLTPEKATVQQNNAQDSDTDVEEMVGTTSKSPIKKKGARVSSRTQTSVVPESELLRGEDDEDTDADEPTEPTVKDDSDTEADDSPSTMALEATQCYLDAAAGEVDDEHSSAVSGDEAEATQAFVFKSPPVKPPTFKKPSVPSPGGSALPMPVCTSSEKEDLSDEEQFAVAETQSFLRGPDISDIDLEDEPTQAFFVGGGTRLQGPSTSTQKVAGSVTRIASNDALIAHSIEVEKEEEEATTLAEAETQLFFNDNLEAAPGGPIRPPEDPSQDETQPIALYLGLQAGHTQPTEACTSSPVQRVTQPLLVRETHQGQQSPLQHRATARGNSQTNKNVFTVNPIKGPAPSMEKTIAFCADSASLLESQEPQKQSVESGQPDESTQHLSLILSEEPTQAYSIDVSEEVHPEPSLEPTGSKHAELSSNLGNAEEISMLPKVCLDGVVAKASIEEDGAPTQTLESPVHDGEASSELAPNQETAANPSILPQISQASEPSDVGSASAQEVQPRSDHSTHAKKKQPSLAKRGRKKKATVEEDAEATTSGPTPEPAEVSTPPAKNETTQLLDVEPQANEGPQTARGRPARRASATSSAPARSKKINDTLGESLQGQEMQPLAETEDDQVGRKGRRGRGLRRRAAIEAPQYEAAAEADPLPGLYIPEVCTEAPVTTGPLAPGVEASVTLSVDTPAAMHTPTSHVEALHTKPVSTGDAEVVISNQLPVVENAAMISNPPMTSVEQASIDPPPVNATSTCADPTDAEEADFTATPVMQRRNAKRGEKTASLPTTEQSVTLAEPETRGTRNRRKASATIEENREEQKPELVPARGRGRQKKEVSSDVSEKQQDSVVVPVDLPAPTIASRSRKSFSGGITEEVVTPTVSVLSRTRRRGPVEKEGTREEHDQPKASGARKGTKKVPTIEATKITELESPSEMSMTIDPTAEQTQEAQTKDSHLSNRHEGRTCTAEQPQSTGAQLVTKSQEGGSLEKKDLVGSQAASLSMDQAVPNDQMEDINAEQALKSIETATSDQTGYASVRPPRKRRTVGNGEQVTENVASSTSDAHASRKRRTIGKEKGVMEKDEDVQQSKKTDAKEEVEVEAGMFLDIQTIKKRGTRKTIEETRSAIQTSGKKGQKEAEASTLAPQASNKKEETADACEGIMNTAEKVATTYSRNRRTIQVGPEAAEEVRENSLLCREPRKGGSREAASEEVAEVQNSTSSTPLSRKRGATKQSEEDSNLGLSVSKEQKVHEIDSASNSAASSAAGDEKSERELEKPTEAAGRRSRKQPSKDLAAYNRAEQTQSSEHARQTEGIVPDTAIAKAEAHSSQSGRNLEGTGKKAEEHQKLDSGVRGAVLKGGAAGRRKRQNKSEEGGQDSADHEESTEQKRRRNNTAPNEVAEASATIEEAENTQSQGNVESTASEGTRCQKQAATSKKAKSQAEATQPDVLQVRGRGSQRKNARKTVEAKITEGEQLASTEAAEVFESVPSQEELHSLASSRSSSRGRKQAQQTDSSQESVAPGGRHRKKSSASSEGKAEEVSAPPQADTPRRRSRTPNLSHSPGVFKEHSAPKVMFTGVIDETGEQVVQRLGGELADSVYECTHLVTDRIRRTVKFLCAVARGIPIVTLEWLEKSGKNKCFLSPSSFLVKDREQELNFSFRLSEALQKAQRQRLFEGYEIHVTPSVKPEPEYMKDIIQCSGAAFLPKMPKEYKDKRVIVSCSQDLAKCKPALGASLPITNSEFILTGILQQVVNVDAFRLEGTPSGAEASKPQGGKRASANCSTPPPATTKRRR
ncbi:mediator of DNA damage checkpoint protein 1 isoform X1 [Pleurodeles waltl]|uniref:mediator of DNA damage checkpoint protein 1 isoform X1 n=1 Tax=Pleurodeles waltl TaxID=8319 RepID=UPI003709BF0C